MGDALDGRADGAPQLRLLGTSRYGLGGPPGTWPAPVFTWGISPPDPPPGPAGRSTPASPQSLSSTARSDTTAWTVWLLTAPRLMPLAEAIWPSGRPA